MVGAYTYWHAILTAMIVVPITAVGALIAVLVYCNSRGIDARMPAFSKPARKIRRREFHLKDMQLDIAEDELLRKRTEMQQRQLEEAR